MTPGMRQHLLHFDADTQARTLSIIMQQWSASEEACKAMQLNISSSSSAAAVLARALDDQWQVSDAIMSSLQEGVAEDAVLDFDFPHAPLSLLKMCDCW